MILLCVENVFSINILCPNFRRFSSSWTCLCMDIQCMLPLIEGNQPLILCHEASLVKLCCLNSLTSLICINHLPTWNEPACFMDELLSRDYLSETSKWSIMFFASIETISIFVWVWLPVCEATCITEALRHRAVSFHHVSLIIHLLNAKRNSFFVCIYLL